jgi:hypothetical protein
MGALGFSTGARVMSIANDRFSTEINGEVLAESTTAETLDTPPSCSSGTQTGSPLLTATSRNGDNRVGGVWEFALNGSLGQYGWIGGTGVPFDTGAVGLDITLDPISGGSLATLSVGSGSPLSLTLGAYTQITAVGIRAEATRMSTNQTVSLRAEWQSLNISFFSDSGEAYLYPDQANPACPMPMVAQTPPPPSFGTTYLSRVIRPGVVSGATYPVRLTLNGTFRLSASIPAEQLSANQIVVKVFIWAS